MDWVRARRPTLYERRALKRMKRQLANGVNRRHARIILLSAGGVCNREIESRVGETPAWVRRILHRWNDGGIGVIWWCPYCCVSRAGPRKFMADVVEQIAEVALSPSKELIGMSVWSLSKLRACLMDKRPSRRSRWSGFVNCCDAEASAGGTPRRGRCQGTLNSGRNTGEFDECMQRDPRAVYGCQSMNLVR